MSMYLYNHNSVHVRWPITRPSSICEMSWSRNRVSVYGYFWWWWCPKKEHFYCLPLNVILICHCIEFYVWRCGLLMNSKLHDALTSQRSIEILLFSVLLEFWIRNNFITLCITFRYSVRCGALFSSLSLSDAVLIENYVNVVFGSLRTSLTRC